MRLLISEPLLHVCMKCLGSKTKHVGVTSVWQTCERTDISVFCAQAEIQVDEENQANTLVSVAPLPQEPLDKPTVNGESPPENGTSPTPTTNGHSASQAPVADTAMWIVKTPDLLFHPSPR